jgi:hypothetical protein
VLAEVIDDQAALVTSDGTELITLNPVGTVVWDALSATNDVAGIVDLVVRACEPVDRARVDADVRNFLAELAAAGLVEIDAGD